VLVAGQLPSGATPAPGSDAVSSPTLTVIGGSDPTPSATASSPALSTQFGSLAAIAVDRKGNTFVATTDSTICKIRPDGSTRLIAGTPEQQGSPTPGPATSSPLTRPFALAVDAAGNLYVADIDAYEVLKISPQGNLSVIVGKGYQSAPTPGPASASAIGRPTGVAVDAGGNVYVSDVPNHVIEKITPGGTLSILAGSGDDGAPVAGPASASPFNGLGALAVRGRNLYFVDRSARKVGTINLVTGTLSLVAGSGGFSFPIPGPALDTGFRTLSGITVDRAGDVFLVDLDNSVVAEVTPDGNLSIVAGNTDSGTPMPGPATSTSLKTPTGVAIDPQGNLVIADINNGNGLVYKVSSTTGDLSIVAGLFASVLSGSALLATIHDAGGIAVDAEGNTYGALGAEHVVFKITPSGTISVVAGNGSDGAPTPGNATASSLGQPFSLAVDAADNLFIGDAENSVVEKLSPTGTLSVVAGTGTFGMPTPGVATASPLGFPAGIAADQVGNLFVADAGNHVVVKVSASGELSIVAGDGTDGGPVPGPATASPISFPIGLAVDGSGNLFFVDAFSEVVGKITASGELSIVAGNGTAGDAIAGPATSSPLTLPWGVAVDASGDLFITDYVGGAAGCGLVEQVTPDGSMSILAGKGECGAAVAGPAMSSPLTYPSFLTISPSGNLEVVTRIQIVSIDLNGSAHRPRIASSSLVAGGLQVRWKAPASLVGKVTGYVATVTDASGVVLGSCSGTRSSRSCLVAGLPGSGQVSVTVVATERQVPHAPQGIMSFSSVPTSVGLGGPG
jgi:sugar lactone lactonase YvrE